MGLINKPWTPSTGDVIDASNYNSNLDTIYNEFNGNIDIANIKSSILNAANGLLQLDGDAAIPSSIGWKAIPSGTKMVFYQATAPTGWTQDTSINDRVLRVVSGEGGGTGGSWIISGLSTESAGSHSHTVNSHTHSTPDHTHTLATDANVNYWTRDSDRRVTLFSGYLHVANHSSDPSKEATLVKSSTTSGGGGTTGSASPGTDSQGSHTHTISSDGSWKPPYLDIIIATKD